MQVDRIKDASRPLTITLRRVPWSDSPALQGIEANGCTSMDTVTTSAATPLPHEHDHPNSAAEHETKFLQSPSCPNCVALLSENRKLKSQLRACEAKIITLGAQTVGTGGRVDSGIDSGTHGTFPLWDATETLVWFGSTFPFSDL